MTALERYVGEPDQDLANARKALKALSEHDLVQLVAAELARLRRTHVRHTERAVTSVVLVNPPAKDAQPASTRVKVRTVELSPETRKLLRLKVSLGRGESVEVGQATREQLLRRIEMLERNRTGIGRTVEQLREIVRVLDETGVACLDELDTAA
jgi:hypothetical protein